MAKTIPYAPNRTRRRYVTLVALVVLLFGGWSGFWYFGSVQAERAIERWRAREAKAGRMYSCGTQRIGGYPFRIEVNCDSPFAVLRGRRPIEIKTRRMFAAWQIYEPSLIITEFTGPLTITEPESVKPSLVVNWSSARSSLRGRPKSPERVALVLDNVTLEGLSRELRESSLRAKHVELHARRPAGVTLEQPVIEAAVRLEQASTTDLRSAARAPMDADLSAVLHGLGDLRPKPWSERWHEMQAAGGRIDISAARIQQGDVLAVGSGTLSLNARGYLEGQLRVTMAGLDHFLDEIGARQTLQKSHTMDRLAGALDRVLPGLGQVARREAGANLSAGVNMLGEPAMLEGRRAVTLPLRFKDGSVFLGPILVGHTAALF